jgi:hypothetical protein
MAASINSLEVPRSALGRTEYLAAGGQARVYRIPEYSLPGLGRLIYKEYKAKTLKVAGRALRAGLLGLANWRVGLPPDRQTALDQRVIWPLRVVTADDGEVAGIVIREIPAEFFHGSDPREMQFLFQADADARKWNFPMADTRTRLVLLARLAAAYGMLHRNGIVIGDVSPKNVLFTTDVQPRVMVIDTDSAREQGTRGAFGGQLHTPDWEPPEARAAKRQIDVLKRASGTSHTQLSQLNDAWQRQTVETDVYKFGLMVVRVLDYGRQRSQNRNPDKARRVLAVRLGASAASLLDRSLGDDPKARPAMRDWYAAFGGNPSASSPADLKHPASRLAAERPGSGAAGDRGPTAGQATANGTKPSPVMKPVGNWQFVEGTGWVRR